MEVIASEQQRITEPVCLMIGNFDGVHLGHQTIIRSAQEHGRQHGYRTAVLSFEPHPLKVLAPEKAPQLLQTPEQKRALLTHFDVDYYVIHHFDEALSQSSPRAFVERLRAQIDFRIVFVGFNFRFGHRRTGNIETLTDLGKEMGFEVVSMPPFKMAGEVVSSSRIRELLKQGEVPRATEWLGRPYFLEGWVETGERLGRQMKVPTANLRVDNELWPRFGVYASWCRVNETWHRSISNIGIAPTRGLTLPRVETHLLDFEGDLYGTRALVVFTRFMREEIRFENMEALQGQIRQDIETRLNFPDTEAPAFGIF